MSFPTKSDVARTKEQVAQLALGRVIEAMRCALLEGRTHGPVSELGKVVDRKALAESFEQNTEWRLTFYKTHENGDYPGDTEIEHWSLS